jgi:phosphoglycolate phosphatase-like HAD superfamily hydrolase
MPRNSNELKKFRLFWDIDGTLIRTNGAAAIPFKKALSDFLKKEVELDRKKLSGFTDFEIIQTVAKSYGVNIHAEEIEMILGNYAQNLPTALQAGDAHSINVITEVLAEIHSSNDFENAIATGNCRPGAIAKLTHINLIEFFKTDKIFHASVKCQTRDQIIADAKQSLGHSQVGIIIGDSPKDILSAKANKLRVLGVATGMHTVDELRNLQSEHVVESTWTKDVLLDAIFKICED